MSEVDRPSLVFTDFNIPAFTLSAAKFTQEVKSVHDDPL
jgi:hypothetical protein